MSTVQLDAQVNSFDAGPLQKSIQQSIKNSTTTFVYFRTFCFFTLLFMLFVCNLIYILF